MAKPQDPQTPAQEGMPKSVFPSSSTSPLAMSDDAEDPLVVIDLDRHALTLHGIETRTCVQCGARIPGPPVLHPRAKWTASGRVAVNLIYGVCAHCKEEETRIVEKVRAANRIVNFFYTAQWGIFFAGVVGHWPTGGLLGGAVALFLGTWAGSTAYRRHLERGQPVLLDADATRVRLRARRSWLRVLRAEHPELLAPSQREPQAITPPHPAEES